MKPLIIRPEVHAEMFRRLQAQDRLIESLQRRLSNAHAAIESRNKLIAELKNSGRLERDREQAEAKRKQRDAVILFGCGND